MKRSGSHNLQAALNKSGPTSDKAALDLVKLDGDQAFDVILASMLRDCEWEHISCRKIEALLLASGADAPKRLIAEIERLDHVNVTDDAGDSKDTLWRQKKALTDVLIGLGSKAEEALLEALLNGTGSVTTCAVRALGKIRSSRAVAPILALIDRKPGKPNLKMYCILALGDIGDPAACDILERMLTSMPSQRKGWLGRSAAQALGQIGGTRSREILSSVARHDPDWFTRLGAVEGLAFHTSPTAIRILRAALRDNDVRVAAEAIRSLRAIGTWYALLTLWLASKNPGLKDVWKTARLHGIEAHH